MCRSAGRQMPTTLDFFSPENHEVGALQTDAHPIGLVGRMCL